MNQLERRVPKTAFAIIANISDKRSMAWEKY